MENQIETIGTQIGRRILAAEMDDRTITLRMDTAKTIKVTDRADYCCERRHMHTDDDIQSLVGHELRGIEVKEVKNNIDGKNYDCRDVAFLEISTNIGSVTVANYNDHNGFYGGFNIHIDVE